MIKLQNIFYSAFYHHGTDLRAILNRLFTIKLKFEKVSKEEAVGETERLYLQVCILRFFKSNKSTRGTGNRYTYCTCQLKRRRIGKQEEKVQQVEGEEGTMLRPSRIMCVQSQKKPKKSRK